MSVFKVVMIGVRNSGKTELTRHLTDPTAAFTLTYTATYQPAVFNGQEQSGRYLEITDTAGCAQDHTEYPEYQDSKEHPPHVTAICVDITNQQSLELARSWLQQLKSDDNQSITAVILVATKWDLVDCPNQAVSADDLRILAAEYGLGNFFSTSALTGHGIATLRERLQKYLLCMNIETHPYYNFLTENLQKLQKLIQAKLAIKEGKITAGIFRKAATDIDDELEGLCSLKTALDQYRLNRNYGDDLVTDLDNLVRAIQQRYASSFIKHGGYSFINFLRPEAKAKVFCTELISEAQRLKESRYFLSKQFFAI
jgi:small GTP-binding protein